MRTPPPEILPNSVYSWPMVVVVVVGCTKKSLSCLQPSEIGALVTIHTSTIGQNIFILSSLACFCPSAAMWVVRKHHVEIIECSSLSSARAPGPSPWAGEFQWLTASNRSWCDLDSTTFIALLRRRWDWHVTAEMRAT
jgi:hypothetical protein